MSARLTITLAALTMICSGILSSASYAQDEPALKPTPIGNPGAWIPMDAYPPAAKASAEEGRVAFTLDVDNAGHVNECKVTKSSESPLLDETTCNLMTANGRFTPPKDKKGKPVASKWSSAVTWRLATPAPPVAPAGANGTPSSPIGDIGTWFPKSAYPPAAKLRREQGRVTVKLALDETGRPTGCSVVNSSASDMLDAVTCTLAVKNGRFHPALDASGKPRATTYTLPAVDWVP